MNNVHYSSKTPEWETPQKVFDDLNAEFSLNWDVCATKENRKRTDYWEQAENGLIQNWEGKRCWMNPPYGREIGHWMKKAFESAQGGATVVCLVPARTDTAWWHDYATKGTVRFIRGRLKFGGHKNAAPFPSAVVIFRP